jgi:hypothetical protein
MTNDEALVWRGSVGHPNTAALGDCSLTVYPDHRRWCWEVIRQSGDWYKNATGWCFTEAEAKEAALAAARGMR